MSSMNSATEEFVLNFHSLTGVTIGERQKSLFYLLHKTQRSLEPQEINFSAVQPKTPLENSLKVEALIYFRKFSELLDVLKSENPILIEKVLKSRWFVKGIFEDISGEQLVTEIFPSVSYNTKLKLINKFSLCLENEHKADEFFNAVEKAYGLYLAAKILPSCSVELIMKYITSNRVDVTPRQLSVIIKKHPSLTEKIFETLVGRYESKDQFSRKYKYVFVCLKQDNLLLFLKLKENYESQVSLGARTTNAFIRINKEDMLKNPNKSYNDILRIKRIARCLKQDYEEYFIGLFPKSIGEFDYYTTDEFLLSLNHLRSKEEKLHFFSKVFKKVHGKEIWEYPELVTTRLLQMISSDERTTWMETHEKPASISESTWIALMKTEKSIPLLKERIVLTHKLNRRISLVSSLIFTCAWNNNTNPLPDVFEYVTANHRNDHHRVRYSLLHALRCCDFTNISHKHWKRILQLTEVLRVSNDYCSISTDIFRKYIHYCFIKELPVKEHLIKWIKITHNYNIWIEDKKVKKQCLILFNELFSLVYEGAELQDQYVNYLSCLRDWNRANSNDKISLFLNADAVKAVQLHLTNNQHAYKAEEIAETCILSDYKKSKELGLVNALLSRKVCYQKVVDCLLKNDPLLFCDYLHQILENVFSWSGLVPSFFKNLCRNYNHLQIPQKITSICLTALSTDGNQKFKIGILSHVIAPQEFLNLNALNAPLDFSTGITSKEHQNTFKLHQAILPTLRNVIPPSLALDTILNFCKGDYVPLVQRSLYSVSHNVSEYKLIPFFNVLNNRTDSVKKHSIYLAFKVLSRAEVYIMLSKFLEIDRSPPVRKSLFKAIFNFFIRNTDDYSWELTKQCVKVLDVKDRESFNILSKHHRIPSQYFAEYILFTWDILENYANSDDLIEEGKRRILEGISETKITKLPRKFCMELIEKYLFKPNDFPKFQGAIHLFLSRYMIYYAKGTEQDECVKSVFYILKNYVKSTWYTASTAALGQKTVFKLIKELCSYIVSRKCPVGASKVVESFLILWNDIFKPYEAVDEYLHLQFTLTYIEFFNETVTVSEIGNKIATFCDLLHSKESLHMDAFCKSLNCFKFHFLSLINGGDSSENQLALVESILRSSRSSNCLILSVLLLPNINLIHAQIERYNAVINYIREDSDPMVQMYLHRYFIEQ